MGIFDFMKYIQWTYNFTLIMILYLYFNIYIFPRGIFPIGFFPILPDGIYSRRIFSYGKNLLWDLSKMVSNA